MQGCAAIIGSSRSFVLGVAIRAHQYRLQLSYNGTPYCGWQSQSHGITVQDTIEKALNHVLCAPHRLVPASRTDTGVHALMQFACFRSSTSITDLLTFQEQLTKQLPPGIQLHHICEVPTEFHPSRDATAKVYCYRVLKRQPKEARLPGYWYQYRPVDIACLKSELHSLIGTHDFTSFCAADLGANQLTRTISNIHVVENGDRLMIWFAGPGFLKQMIRIIVGSALEKATGKTTARTLLEILAAKSRLAAGRTAPADGLFLTRVSYKETAQYPVPDEEFDAIFK